MKTSETSDQFNQRLVRQLRKLCLELPETSETASWGHPNFRAGKRTFVTFEMIKGRPSIALRLDPAETGLLLRRKHFFATPYGRGLWVSLWADDGVDWNHVTELVDRSYRIVANKRMLKLLDDRRNSVKTT